MWARPGRRLRGSGWTLTSRGSAIEWNGDNCNIVGHNAQPMHSARRTASDCRMNSCLVSPANMLGLYFSDQNMLHEAAESNTTAWLRYAPEA